MEAIAAVAVEQNPGTKLAVAYMERDSPGPAPVPQLPLAIAYDPRLARYPEPSYQPPTAEFHPVSDSNIGNGWVLELYSYGPKVPASQIHQCRLARSSGHLEAQIHDLLAGSLGTLFDAHCERPRPDQY
jgi:hypothetical protein